MKVLKSLLAIILVASLLWSRSWLPEPDANADNDPANGILMTLATDVPSVKTGRSFTYSISFSFSDLESSNGLDPSELKLILPKPDGVVFDDFIPLSILSGAPTKTASEWSFGFKATGAGGPQAGTTYVLQINAHYTSHTTPDGTETTTIAKIVQPDAGGGAPVTLEESNSVTVKAEAEAVWELIKKRSSPIPEPRAGDLVQYEITFNNDNSGSDIGVVDIQQVRLVDNLPPEAEFVSASPAPLSAPNAGDMGGQIVWEPSGTLVDDTRYYVTVRYPASEVTAGTTNVINNATVTYQPLGENTTETKTASATHGFTDQYLDNGPGGFYKNTDARQQEISPGQDVRFYMGGFRNNSNSTISDAVITDMTPTKDTAGNNVDFDLKSIDTALFHDAGVSYAVYYTTTSTPGAGDWQYWQAVSPASSEKLEVSALNLGGAHVMGVQFRFAGELPVSFSQTSEFILTYTLRSGATITDGHTIRNTATVDYTFNSSPKHGSDDADVKVHSARPLVRIDKTRVPGGPYVPSNDTEASYVEFDIKISNTEYSSADFHNPIVFDLLPKYLTYASWSIVDQSGFDPSTLALDPALTIVPNGAGQTLLRWKFPGNVEMPINSSFTIRVKAKIDPYTPATTYTNAAGVTSNTDPYINDYYFNTLKTDTPDLDGDGITTDTYIGSNADVTVNRVAELGSYKRVRGELDSDWKEGTFPTGCTFGQPCDKLANTVAGGRVDYKLTVKNNSNFEVDHIVVVDSLPRIGDEGALLGARGSEWATVLTDPLPANPDYTVYYNTDTGHVKIGQTTGWSTTPPADLTTVTALKFEFTPTKKLAPGQEIPIVWSMKAPVGTQVDRIAWNSFAHQAQEVGTGTPLLPAEPPKVGVHIKAPTGLALGDYVWADLDKDGIQDAGEPGINGVKVKLLNADGSDYKKHFADGDVSVTTVTGPDAAGSPGYYLFPELPAGNYKVQFELPTALPEDYSYGSGANAYTNAARHFTTWTLKGVGADAEVDSNVGGAAGVPNTSAAVTTDTVALTDSNDLTIDAGLEPPVGAIGDYVWYDRDGNGKQDAGEPGISGVTVELFKQTGSAWTSQATQTTGANGEYLFDNLLPGKYKVKFPTTLQYNADGNGVKDVLLTARGQGNPTKDSNTYNLASATSFGSSATASASKPIGFSEVIDLQLGEENRTVDAGYLLPVELGDTVWFDGDADGKQNGPDDEPQAGVKVNLLSEGGSPIKDEAGVNLTATTDASGHYKFDHLLPGKYIVEFELPSGYGFTRKNRAGSPNDPAADSDVNRTANLEPTLQTKGRTDVIASVMTPGLSDMTIDAGLVKLVSLGDFVWNDKNENSIQDAGESGVPSVKVNLYYEDDSTSAIYRTADTTALGKYQFDNLYPGNYKVEFVRGDGYLFTIKGQGTADKDSDANVPGVPTEPKAKTDSIPMLNTDNLDIDAGLIELASVGDKVWLDTDGDNVQTSGESGVAGVTVELFESDGTTPAKDGYGAATPTITTNSDGKYEFKNLSAGDYVVKFTLPTGYWFVQPAQGADAALDSNAIKQGSGSVGLANVTLATGDHNMTIDAGVHTLASLGDKAWHDLNGDGVQDSGEPGVQGVKVELYESDGTTPARDAYGTLVAAQTTDVNGNYKFINLADGTYKVKFSNLAGGFSFTGKNQTGANEDSDAIQSGTDEGWTDAITLTIGQQRTDIDAGIVDRVSLGDYVWNDKNFNGIQDSGELPVAGVTVKLYDASDLGTVIKTETTDVNGKYLFDGLWPGDYVVQFELPSDDYMFTHTGVGTDRLIDSNADDDASGTAFGFSEAVTLVSGQNNLTIDAGLVELASVGDTVWHDANDNGIQDATEAGFAGVVVHLLDATGQPVLKNGEPVTTTTAPNGHYAFTKLVPGDYIVQFDLPNDYIFAKKNVAGATTDKDSDADPADGRTAVVSLAPGENDIDVDAGIVKLTALGDYVWMDRNLNGIQDTGETGVAGVTVRLLDGSGAPVLDGGVPVTTTTDADGHYMFEHLLPGMYKVAFDLPAHYVFTTPNVGSLDALDSDADPAAGGMTAAVTLASGDVDKSLDAGLIKLVNLGDKLWVDLGAIGRQDGEPDDAAAGNVKVYLLHADGTPVLNGSTAVETVTDAAGHYLFTDLYPGDYKVRFDLPAGYMFTRSLATGTDYTTDNDSNVDADGLTGIISLTAGQDDMSVDAGIVQPASLGDFVWEDLNANGLQDADELGKNGLKVELLDANGHVLDSTTTADLAGKPGYYRFDGLMPDTYQVRFTYPNGYMFTTKHAPGDTAQDSDAGLDGFSDLVTLTPGEYRQDVDAGFYVIPNIPPAGVGDYVWKDVNGDGVQNDTERGVNGVTVELYNQYDALIATRVTADDEHGNPGYYLFDGLNPENYYLRFILPAGYQFSKQGQGTDRNLDSNADLLGKTAVVVLLSGQRDRSIDAGLVPLSSLGDYVWIDANGNGRQDVDELGMNGVQVSLIDGDGNEIAMQFTGNDAGGHPGYYEFKDLTPGSYRVSFRLPEGYAWTTVHAGGSKGDNDSDAGPDGLTGAISLLPGAHDLTVDAGLVLKKDAPESGGEQGGETPGSSEPGHSGNENGSGNGNSSGNGNGSSGNGSSGQESGGSSDGDGGDSGTNGAANGSSNSGSANGAGQLPKTGETAPIYPYIGYGLIAASLILFGLRLRKRKPGRTL